MDRNDWTVLEGESEQVPTAVTLKTIKEMLEEQGAAHLIEPQTVPRPTQQARQRTPGLQSPPRAGVQPRRPAARIQPEPDPMPEAVPEAVPAPAPRGLVARLFKRR